MPGIRHTRPGPPRWRRRIDIARAAWHRLGARGVVSLVLKRLAPSPWAHHEWFAVIQRDLREAAGDDRAAQARWGTLDDVSDLLALGREETELRERLVSGDRVVMHVRDDLVAYCWFRAGEYDEQGIVFRLGPGDRWIYDVWVAEQYRSRGHGLRMARDASRALAAEGVTRVLGNIDHLNRASLRAARGVGYLPVGSIWMIRVLGISLRREVWDGRRPRWCLYRGSRPIEGPAPGEPVAHAQPLAA